MTEPVSSSDTLMIGISGVRGLVGRDLTPEVVARWAAALGAWADGGGRGRTEADRAVVVVGRDSRTSGEMFAAAAAAGLLSVGCDVIDLGVVPTPTTQLAVEHHHAAAGLMLSASHNPIEWNALKLIGPDGVFLDADAGSRVRTIAESGPPRAGWDRIGSLRRDDGAIARHLDLVLTLPWIEPEAIRRRAFHVALDCVRGAGGRVLPELLRRLGCRVTGIGLEPDGRFPREPEPVPENLGQLADLVRRSGADVGMAVDPDVDRLALVSERGEAIGEDYTLALAVRAVLEGEAVGRRNREPESPVVVVNLSTSLVVEDAARAVGARLVRAPVGEAHVVRAIRDHGALIGGEGNGGVILPSLHLGRDAPLGVALVLQYLTTRGATISALLDESPRYRIRKAKAPRPGGEMAGAYKRLVDRFPDAEVDRRDGLRLSWPGRWFQLRPSGTEPIVRLIAEAPTAEEAEALIAAGRDALGIIGRP